MCILNRVSNEGSRLCASIFFRTRRVDISCRMSIVSRAAFRLESSAAGIIDSHNREVVSFATPVLKFEFKTICVSVRICRQVVEASTVTFAHHIEFLPLLLPPRAFPLHRLATGHLHQSSRRLVFSVTASHRVHLPPVVIWSFVHAWLWSLHSPVKAHRADRNRNGGM